MFQKGDFVFYASGGICRIEDIQIAPLPGMPQDQMYYVLRSVHDSNGVTYLPTNCTAVFLRPILTAGEAESLLQSANELDTISAQDAKSLRASYQQAMRTYNPSEWVRVLKTVRSHAVPAEGTTRPQRLSETERTFGEEARKYLYTELSLALNISDEQIEQCLFQINEKKAE